MNFAASCRVIVPTLGLGLIFSILAPVAEARDAATVLDRRASLGWETSLVLDSTGTPVISYFDGTNLDLKLIICGSQSCKGKATEMTLDSDGDVGRYSSLALDHTVFGDIPVIAYYDATLQTLKVLRCADSLCGGKTIATPDASPNVGRNPSLKLDPTTGFAVVSYYDADNERLKILRCGDATCLFGNTIESPDPSPAVAVGRESSLALDAAGKPVVAYNDSTNSDLKVLHCSDASCTGDQSANIVTVDAAGIVGDYISLALDAGGSPVIAYYAQSDGVSSIQTLKVAHCADAGCTSGTSFQLPDVSVSVGWYPSLLLDASGFPVVSYFDFLQNQIKLLHCGDANCAAGNTIATPDAKDGGFDTSLALDAFGFPLVSYSSSSQQLKLLICDDPACLR